MRPLCMTISAIALAIFFLPLLSGCKSLAAGQGADAAYSAAFREKMYEPSTLSVDEAERLQQVKMIETAAGLEGNFKGEVVGLSCKLTPGVFVFKWIWKPALSEAYGLTPEEAARTQLRLKAMKIGANAVVAPSCTHKDGVDWGNNCFESWRCTGQAFVVQ